MDKISVIIVNWNVAPSLKKCLLSVFATNYPNLEVIVVDNASTDNSLATISGLENRIIKNSTNVGLPKAINQGLKIATGDYILQLNPDTRLPEKFFEKSLQFFSSHPDAGVMGPKFMDPDGTIQGSVFSEPSIFKSTDKYTPTSGVPVPVNCISGACMFFPKSTFNKVGYFTEEVFMYYEDFDYCRRIRRTGLKVYFNPEIIIVHEHGRSSAQTSNARKYLTASSIWYNGPIKYYLQTLVLKVKSKLK